jgi:hypothetical protein
MHYTDLYEKTPNAIHTRIYKYKESTPIFSYYILKSIMMFYVNDYIEWCAIHNHWSLDFNKNPKTNNLIEYCRFIREHYKNAVFLHNIELIEKQVFKKKSNSNHHVSNDDITETLRMTVFEIQ